MDTFFWEPFIEIGLLEIGMYFHLMDSWNLWIYKRHTSAIHCRNSLYQSYQQDSGFRFGWSSKHQWLESCPILIISPLLSRHPGRSSCPWSWVHRLPWEFVPRRVGVCKGSAWDTNRHRAYPNLAKEASRASSKSSGWYELHKILSLGRCPPLSHHLVWCHSRQTFRNHTCESVWGYNSHWRLVDGLHSSSIDTSDPCF